VRSAGLAARSTTCATMAMCYKRTKAKSGSHVSPQKQKRGVMCSLILMAEMEIALDRKNIYESSQIRIDQKRLKRDIGVLD
jgi:hypothetical protein